MMIKYKEFKIKELFYIYTGRDIIIRKTVKGEYPLVSHQHENNGIVKYIQKIENRKLFKASDTIALADRGVFLATTQNKNFYIGTRVKALTFKDGDKSEKIRLFFTTAINKLQIFFSEYSSNATDTLPNLKIYLPINEDDKIDFQFMEDYISKIEKEYIRKFERNLKASGYDNYVLSKEEQKAINNYKSKTIKYKEFKIKELFDIHPTKAYKYTNSLLFNKNGKTPVVTNSSLKNGITGYSNLKPTEKGNIITYSDTTTSEGIFYQPNDFIGYSHIQGLYPYNKRVWNKESLLYFVTLFKKCAFGKFNYGTKFNRKIAMEMMVKLPINEKGEIDFNFMENYIKSEEKLVLKVINDWKNKITSNTK